MRALAHGGRASTSAVLTDLIERHGAESEAQAARESASLYHRAKYGQVAYRFAYRMKDIEKWESD